ncbi:MAG TPA: AI-2E family transporter [Candidatus Saccharimonadales bacterium]|nr:AI-2E family transporter [Candidatus Saccharimonadales bacterium]
MISFRRDKEIPEVALTISLGTFVRLALFVIATVLLLAALHRAAHALLLIFTAFFLALALNSPVTALGRHLPGRWKNNRALSTSLSLLIVILLFVGFVASFAPSLVNQTENFVGAAPKIVRDFRSQNSDTGRLIRKYHLGDQVDELSSQLSSRLHHIGGSAFPTIQRIGTSIFSLLTILVLTFMMLVESPRWRSFVRQVVPDNHHGMAKRLSVDMYRVIKGYVNGQVLLAAIAAGLMLPGLLFFHVSYPAALVVVVFVCGLIPMVGHTIGAIIVGLVALLHSVGSAAGIFAYYLLYQQIENYLIQPRIQANTTNMSPLLVFASVVVGVSFGGLFGGLVAIPVAGCLRIALLEYLRSQNIIDTPEFKKVTTEQPRSSAAETR